MSKVLVRTLAFMLLQQLLLVDIGSAVYASLVVPLLFQPPTHLFWPLWLAKYHGFSVNLATTGLLVCVLRNIRKAVANRPEWLWRGRAVLEHRFGCQRLFNAHTVFAYRVLCSAILHTLMHVLFTHPFRLEYDEQFHEPITVQNLLLLNRSPMFDELPILERLRFVLLSFFRDTHTWTGYALLVLLLLPILLTGLRLARFARRHFTVLQLHRVLAYLLIPLAVLHHPIYGWPFLWTLILFTDMLLGVYRYTEHCVIRRILRFPHHQLENETQENDVVEVSFDYPHRCLANFQPGNYVRVNVPRIDRFEWHDLTLMRNDDNKETRLVHVTVRNVGRWTGQFYRLLDVGTRIRVKGPYNNTMYDPILQRILLSKSSRFETAAVPAAAATAPPSGICDLRRLSMPRNLVLICTGTAITHFLSILDTLIPLYYHGCSVDELPRQIVLCWTVRTIFNLNFALLSLARYQQLIADRRLDRTLSLVYEFFVSQQPENSEVIYAQTFRRMLLAVQQGKSPLMMRNSRLSRLDLTTHDRVSTSLGVRVDFQRFGERYLREEGTVIMMNTAVASMRQEIRKLARLYNCTLYME